MVFLFSFTPLAISSYILNNVSFSPTFPGKTIYGRSGYLLSFPESHTGIPGANCPNTFAFLIPKPFVAVSLDVIPPLAIIKAGLIFIFFIIAISPSDILVAIFNCSSSVPFGISNLFLFV